MEHPNGPIMTDVAMTANANSLPVFMKQEFMASLQAVWTGSPVGNFTIETTLDEGHVNPDGTVSGLVNWDTYTGSSQAAGGSTGVFTWRLTSVPDRWVRLHYAFTSGSGTVNARFQAKGV